MVEHRWHWFQFGFYSCTRAMYLAVRDSGPLMAPVWASGPPSFALAMGCCGGSWSCGCGPLEAACSMRQGEMDAVEGKTSGLPF